MSAEIIPMPAPPSDLLSVRRFHAFEENGRRLMLVVENAAFIEADEPSWALALMLEGRGRVRRSELTRALIERFGSEEAMRSLAAFEKLDILAPYDRPRQAADLVPIELPRLSSLVLHVAHDCNLRCGYCYADFGRYGGDFGIMSEALAIEHCRAFFDQLHGVRNVHLTFFGGEPLMNLPVVFAAHRYSKERASREGIGISYGLTTNGTLLTDDLVGFFAREGFTITVSIDGPPDVHDRLRPLQDGGGSYGRIMERVRATGIKAIARVTLTRRSTDVARIVRHLIEAGFREVGVSPVATGSDKFDLSSADLGKVLEGMGALSEDFVTWAKEGRLFPFSNMRVLLEQIAAGDPRPLPCGAGTKLVAADNKGDLYACHRLVGEDRFRIGHVKEGVDETRRLELVEDMHPRGRAPCRTCWARTLCGGGCHHIAWLHSGKRAAPWTVDETFCDFLRAWYRLGLYTYARLVDEAPGALLRLGKERAPCSQPSGL